MLAKVARAAGVKAGDPVIEVGPGTGLLTEKLLDSGACVLALEKDRDFCQLLRKREDWVRLQAVLLPIPFVAAQLAQANNAGACRRIQAGF